MPNVELTRLAFGQSRLMEKLGTTGETMEPYLPIYRRPPNKFLRYEERRFDDGAGHTGTVRIALYQDRNGKQREETAQVIWDKGCPYLQVPNEQN